jgi:hypothetical protein
VLPADMRSARIRYNDAYVFMDRDYGQQNDYSSRNSGVQVLVTSLQHRTRLHRVNSALDYFNLF